MVGRIADWVTIITAPLSLIITISAWLGKLDEISQSSQQGSIKPQIFAAILIIFVWCFFFFSQLRVFALFYRKLSETASFYISYVIALVGLCLSSAIELLILDSLIPETKFPLVMLGWISLPVIVWIVRSIFAVSIVSSGLYKKEIDSLL